MKQDNLGNLKTAKNREDVFTKTRFTNWRKATDKFSEHQKSKCHELALTFEITIPKCGDVLEMSSDAALKRRVEERKYFLKIIDCVQFFARQGFPFRGHDTNEENFRQVMFLRCKDSPELMKRIAESTTVVTEKSSAPK